MKPGNSYRLLSIAIACRIPVLLIIGLFLMLEQELLAQSPTNPGFENDSPFSWTQQAPTSDVYLRSPFIASSVPRTGSGYIVMDTKSSSLFECRSDGSIAVPNNSYVHILGWARTTTNFNTSLSYVGINMNNTLYIGSGTAMTADTTYTRLTYSVQNTTGSSQSANARVLNQRTGGPGAPREYAWDDILMYTSNSNITDIIKPVSPTGFIKGANDCSSISFSWTNGSDGQTGVQGTYILRTTNLSAVAPELNDQGQYSTMGAINGPNLVGADWTIISTSVSAGSTTYNDNTVANGVSYKYAVIHRDLAYNYSPALVSGSVSIAFTTAPTITGSNSASRCGPGTVSLSASASAGTINWYASLTGGSSLGSGTSFTTPTIASTTVYYVDANINGCTTPSRTEVTATIHTIHTITGTTPASRCGNGTVTLSATASGGTINWYAASIGGVSLGSGTNFTTPSISSTTIYYVDATANGCTSPSRTAITATINAIPTITGTTPASRCGTGTLNLSATASAGTINWYAAATGGASLGSGSAFTTPSISSTTSYWVDATANGCTTASRTEVIATILPPTPATPGAISGTAAQGPSLTNQTYSITAVANATSYTWTVPAGWMITSGNGSTSITVSTGSMGQNGNITVSATNSCGTSANQTLAVTVTATLSGNIYEDINYSGGAGRNKVAGSGVGRSAARVELYNASGVYSTFTTTDVNGNYLFSNLSAGDYYIRVVNTSVTSSRPGYTTACLPVQTFCTNAATGTAAPLTDRVGGTNPAVADPGNGSAGATLNTSTFVYSAVLTGTAQSVAKAVITTANIGAIDFGFNFNTIVNTNNTGQGSLRQFVTNANLLGNTGLAITGYPAGQDVSIFMISNGTAVPGLRSGLTNQLTSGVARITILTTLPISSSSTTIDATTQTANIGNTNPGVTGTGGTVGIDAIPLPQYELPEVEINGSWTSSRYNPITISGATSNILIQGFAIYNGGTMILMGGTGTNRIIRNMLLGTRADGTKPDELPASSTARTYNYNVEVSNGSTGTVDKCYVGWSGQSGIIGTQPNGEVIVTYCEVFGSSWRSSGHDGIDVDGKNSVIQYNLSHTNTTSSGNPTGGAGNGIECGSSTLGGFNNTLIENNTLRNNITAGITIRSGVNGITVRKNLIFGNPVGVVVSREGVNTNNNLISMNSIYSNTNLGIDLSLSSALGDGVTSNNGTKSISFPNYDMDYPVLTSVTKNGTTLSVAGYVGSAPGQTLFANARVEIFKSDNDPSGYGEGQTYLGFLTTDANGNFSGTMTVSGVDGNDKITGTATDENNNTSEFGPVYQIDECPAQPGAISGVASQCSNYSGQVYSISSVPFATSYNWTVPVGWSITAGQGTTSITVAAGNFGQNGIITVSASNSCGTSAASDLNVSIVASPTITGTTPASRCATGIVTLGSTSSAGTINWYAALTGGASLGTGTNFTTPSISTTTTYYVEASANGCTTPSRTAVTATVNPTPSASITYTGSPYCSGSGSATVTRTGTTGGSYSSTVGLIIDAATGTININASTDGTYTVTYTIAASGGCSTYQTTTTVRIVAAGTWLGTVSRAWSNGANWLCGQVPTAVTNVTIPGGTPYSPLVSTSEAFTRNLVIQTGATLTVDGAALSMTGAVTNNGMLDAINGGLTFNGTSAQTIPVNADTTISIKDLVVNNAAGVSTAGRVAVTNILTVSSGSLHTGDQLTLKSTVNGTARLTPLPTDGNGVATTFINGKVTMEKYLPMRKAWHLLTAPVKAAGAPSINDAWQEGLTTASPNPNLYPGYGAHIIGGSVTSGFDQGPTSTPSIKVYNNAINNFSPIPASTGTYAPITNFPGYYLYVRGDRGINLQAGLAAAVTETVLRIKGNVNTGNVTTPVNAVNFTVLGNPYPSPINFGTVTRNNVKNGFYMWDTQMSGAFGLGAYVAFSWNDDTNEYDATASASGLTHYIPGGEAIFIESEDGINPGTVTIKETDKPGEAYTTAGNRYSGLPQKLRVNLYGANVNATSLLDGVLTTYKDGNNNGVDFNDAKKLSGSSESIALKRSGSSLSIERRATVSGSDTSYLSMYQMKLGNYHLEVQAENLDANATVAILKDSYSAATNNMVLNTNGTTIIPFTINSNPASYNAARFSIVFARTAVLPVTFKTISAVKKQKEIAVSWTTTNEVNVHHYEVERSADARNFELIHSTTAKASNGGDAAYDMLDKMPTPGINYYRVKSVDIDHKMAYSQIVQVTMPAEKAAPSMQVFPNAGTGNVISVRLKNIEKGNYTLSLYNSSGQLMAVKTIKYDGVSPTTEGFDLNDSFAGGTYTIQLTGTNIKLHTSMMKW